MLDNLSRVPQGTCGLKLDEDVAGRLINKVGSRKGPVD